MALRVALRTSQPLLRASPRPTSSLSQWSHQLCTRNYADDAKPRNEKIRYRYVKLVDPVTGHLTPSKSISELLNGREKDDKDRFLTAVELVTTQPEPIVRYVNIKDEYRKHQQFRKKELQASRLLKEKEIQMTWQVGVGDVEHKLKKARVALGQGQRVFIVYAPKRGQPRPTPDEMRAKLQDTVDMLKDVAVEFQHRKIQPPATGIVYLKPLPSP